MTKLYLFISTLLLAFSTSIAPSIAQNASQDAKTNSLVEGERNNVNQNINQNVNQNNTQSNNRNEVDINNTNITPLVVFPNSENDLGVNFSVGVNNSETTFFVGFTYQPGRSISHKKRMKYLDLQNQLMEVRIEIAETKLKFLQEDFVNFP